MERLFSPCEYFYAILAAEGRLGEIDEDDRENFDMVTELNLNVSREELLSAGREFTYADLYTMLGD
jgi:hypothetical protein